jgi:hypothetical protein
MSRLTIRSVLVVGAFAAGCAPQNVDSTFPSATGSGGGGVVVSGQAGMCGSLSGPVGGPAGGTRKAPSGPGILSPFTPRLGPTYVAAEAPPAISGGTLRILADGHTAVAADPDRDRVYVVDLVKRQVTQTVMLQHGDEPGRVVADAAGRVHVALRRGGALVTIVPSTGVIVERRAVCAAPRGVAYDKATDLLHVACADGQLVSLPAAGGAAVRTLTLDPDLRDVVVDGTKLRISRFRSAELLTVEANGTRSGLMVPTAFRSSDTRGRQLFTASVAWRALEIPTGGVAILHQRGVVDEVQPAAGGYGGFSACDAIVQTAVTTVAPGQDMKSGPALAGLVLAVDMAISADGNKIAIVSPGNSTNSETEGGPARLPVVFVTDMASATDSVIGCASDGQHGPCLPNGQGFFGTGVAGTTGSSFPPPGDPSAGASPSTGAGGAMDPGAPVPSPSPFPTTCDATGTAMPDDPAVPQIVGEPTAVAFDGSGQVVVQSREPAMLELPGGGPITLSTESRVDTGHTIFHANAGGFVACASCHAEGSEDGRIWNFTCEGPRRTQSLQVGLKGTEPFHWGGDEKDFSQLVSDVFVGRMSGPELAVDQVDATLNWLDAQPRIPRPLLVDAAAAQRGRALFNDSTNAACATCHTGANLTNNQSVDVGTGGKFQVPSLVGIGSRGPYMHNGCAETLRDRFSPGACGGGDKHGVTSKMSPGQISDMVAFLNTL